MNGGQEEVARRAREAQRSRKAPRRTRVEIPRPRVRFGHRNLLLFAAGGVSIAVGYVLLSAGSITLAPILLVAGYCVFFPMGILARSGVKAGRGGE